MQNIRIIGEVQLEFTIYTSIVYIYDNTAILNKCGHGDIILILQYIFMMWPIVVVLKSFALYLFVFGVDTFFFVVQNENWFIATDGEGDAVIQEEVKQNTSE